MKGKIYTDNTQLTSEYQSASLTCEYFDIKSIFDGIERNHYVFLKLKVIIRRPNLRFKHAPHLDLGKSLNKI